MLSRVNKTGTPPTAHRAARAVAFDRDTAEPTKRPDHEGGPRRRVTPQGADPVWHRPRRDPRRRPVAVTGSTAHQTARSRCRPSR